MFIENPLDILGTGHVHDPEAERMDPLIPQNLSNHHHSKRGKGLPELVFGAKVGQPAEMNMGTHGKSLLVRNGFTNTAVFSP